MTLQPPDQNTGSHRPPADASTDDGTQSPVTPPKLPVNAILDGYFWERRRRRAIVPITVGVLGLTAISLVQELPLRSAVERDLTARSTKALRAAGVDEVKVRFEGRDGTLTGTVTNPAHRDAAIVAVQQVAGVRAAQDRLSGPAEPARATPPAPEKTGAHIVAQLRDGQLAVTGCVPSAAARADLLAAAHQTAHPKRLSSRITVDSKVTGTGLDRLAAVLAALGPNAEVTVELRDGRLTLAGGVASKRQIRRAVVASAAVTGDPRKVANRLTVDPGVTVTAAVRALPPVTFRTAYSTPTEHDEAAIRRLAGALRTNPGVRLEVQGFTDNVGDPNMNYGLSFARARTVRNELQRLGVPRSHLSFKAFGEKNPKLPNTSAANRAANRRVEFVVVR